MIEKLLSILKGELAVRESKINNVHPRIQEDQTATKLAPGAWPWCAAFISWGIQVWGQDQEVLNELYSRGYLAEALPGNFNRWRPQLSLAYDFEKWGIARKRQGIQVFDDRAVPKVGDIVTYDWSHVGLVVDIASVRSNMKVIEGNTQPRTKQRDGKGGDGVYIMDRKISDGRKFIRILP
jgi:hypothetical protein